MNALITFSRFIGKTFALWAVVFAILGFFFPETFIPLKTLIVPALGIIMFGMGLTLKLEDFTEVFKRPLQVLIGLGAQFIIMPLLALMLTKVFALDPVVAIGVILVGCCPGGTSSNVITFLAKGDVALSVTITAFATILAPLLTSFLLQMYAGELINIPLMPMMIAIAKIVLLPIIAGVIANKLLGDKVKTAIEILPLISVSGIVVIIAIVVALSHTKIAESGVLIFSVIVLHNLLGYISGYVLARLCGFSAPQQRAIMIEVGMQNSGLGAALAASFFSPVAALPSALFSVWHNISGALLANVCSKNDKE